MGPTTVSFVILLLAVGSRAQFPITGSPRAPSPALAPAPAGAIVSANVSGSLGYLCSSRKGILIALQGVASNQNSAGLNVTIPQTLSDATSLSQLSVIAWHYIVTYSLPFIAKTLSGVSANATLINTFSSSSQTLSNYTTTTIAGGVTPNVDTLYNQAFLDLSQGPQVITVPTFEDPKRYWIVPFLDAYLNYYGAIGSDYGSTAGRYLVVGRGTPRNQSFEGFSQDRIFYSPTDINWVIGRVLVLNDTDAPTAYSYSRQFNITPYGLTAPRPYNASSKAAQIAQAVNGSGYGSYFNSLGFLDGFSRQPASWFNVSANYLSIDRPVNGSTDTLISNLRGLVQNASDPSTTSLFQLGNAIAKQCIRGADTGIQTSTGWTYHLGTGIYTTASGTDYLLRAQDAQVIPAALPIQQVIYYLSKGFYYTAKPDDSSTGQNYTISINLPVPAAAFWSLIIYNASELNLGLYQNPINRYSISDRSQNLVYSGTNNSTVNVFVSATAPPNGTVQYANWLPAPTNVPFVFILRTYIPPTSSLNGLYIPPAIVPTNNTVYTPISNVAANSLG